MRCSCASALLHFFTVEAVSFYLAIASHFDVFLRAFRDVKTTEYGVAELNECFDWYAWEYLKSFLTEELHFTCRSREHYIADMFTTVAQYPKLTPIVDGKRKQWQVDMTLGEHTSRAFILVGFTVPLMVVMLLFWSAWFVFYRNGKLHEFHRCTGKYIAATWELEFQWQYKIMSWAILLLEAVTQIFFLVMMIASAHMDLVCAYMRSTTLAWIVIMYSFYKIAQPSQANHPYSWRRALHDRTVKLHDGHFLNSFASFFTTNDQLAIKFSDALEHAMHDRKGHLEKLDKLFSTEGEATEFLANASSDREDELRSNTNVYEQIQETCL